MLSTPVRKEINNDLRDVQERELKTYAQHSLYGGQQTIQETVYDRRFEAAGATAAGSFGAETLSRSSIAKKLFGEDFAAYESASANKKTKDFSDPNLMPSKTTMHYPGLRTYFDDTQVTANTTTRTRMSQRTKILIAGYIAIVLALVLIITLATMSVATLFSDVSALEAQLNEQITRVDMLNDELEYASSASNIMLRAEMELGMELPSNAEVQSFPQPVTKDAPAYTVSSNWFDSFTNWLSNLFS